MGTVFSHFINFLSQLSSTLPVPFKILPHFLMRENGFSHCKMGSVPFPSVSSSMSWFWLGESSFSSQWPVWGCVLNCAEQSRDNIVVFLLLLSRAYTAFSALHTAMLAWRLGMPGKWGGDTTGAGHPN